MATKPRTAPITKNSGRVVAVTSGSEATWKSCEFPSHALEIPIAVAAAANAAMAVRRSKLWTSSSSTKAEPAKGALNAVAKPAPAPAANSARQSGQGRRKIRPINTATVAPICTVGPSRPSARPPPIASTPPANLTGASE